VDARSNTVTVRQSGEHGIDGHRTKTVPHTSPGVTLITEAAAVRVRRARTGAL
jgi:hypothetical protein